MNAVLWILQVVLAVLFVVGGAYKSFMFEELAGTLPLSQGGWRALGLLEMVGGILLVVPAATGWMPQVTALAAAVLTVEAIALAAFYANYSLALTAANPLVWAVVMAVLAAAVAYGRLAAAPAA